MVMKAFATVSMLAVIGFGAALVAKSDSPFSAPPEAVGGGYSSAPGGVGSLDSGERIEEISTGEEVSLSAHADPDGAYTVFVFSAEW